MTALESLQVAPPMAVKRKPSGEVSGCPASKKLRVVTSNSQSQLVSPHAAFRPHEGLVRQLSPRYAVKTMSVQPSSKISQHIDKALEHLGRFNPWDTTVLPGVVHLYARSKAMNKLITISETVRRRINEAEQKWFSHTAMTESELEAQAPHLEHLSVDLSVVDDTMAVHGNGDMRDEDEEDEEEDEGFETMATAPTVFEQAVMPTRTEHRAYLSIFISRVPTSELRALLGVGFQTNERHIDEIRSQKTGVMRSSGQS